MNRMMQRKSEIVRQMLALLLCCSLLAPQAALAQQSRAGENGFTFKVTSELVLGERYRARQERRARSRPQAERLQRA